MPLETLQIRDLRCIEHAELELSPGLNLIEGANGSGKTSLLEGIFLLGRGRSFRTRNSARLVRIGQSGLLVFGRVGGGDKGGQPHVVGVQLTREGGTEAKIDGEFVGSLAELSATLPVQVINPEIHRLVEEGPARRRRWLDWLVFHVEPGFIGHWVRYQRALRQRNAALRTPAQDLSAWNQTLSEAGASVDRARASALQRLEPFWQALSEELCGRPVKLGYQRGWPAEQTLVDALNGSIARDLQFGATGVGPHRADVSLRSEGRAAREILSRGQQKLTAIAMTLAQLELLRAETGLNLTLLLDDPQAELDAQRLQLFLGRVRALDCQLVVTALQLQPQLLGTVQRQFHVEQGRVEQR
jgi:DNA replication and repair protein RecF